MDMYIRLIRISELREKNRNLKKDFVDLSIRAAKKKKKKKVEVDIEIIEEKKVLSCIQKCKMWYKAKK